MYVLRFFIIVPSVADCFQPLSACWMLENNAGKPSDSEIWFD